VVGGHNEIATKGDFTGTTGNRTADGCNRARGKFFKASEEFVDGKNDFFQNDGIIQSGNGIQIGTSGKAKGICTGKNDRFQIVIML
jgi:hypothetical protein